MSVEGGGKNGNHHKYNHFIGSLLAIGYLRHISSCISESPGDELIDHFIFQGEKYVEFKVSQVQIFLLRITLQLTEHFANVSFPRL